MLQRAGGLDRTHWSAAPVILIFADSDDGAAAAAAGAAAVGARVAASRSIPEAFERIDGQVAMDLVIVDIVGDHGPLLDRLLDRISVGAGDGAFAAVLVIAPELVDIVAARIDEDAVAILVGRQQAALEAALLERLSRAVPCLRDDGAAELGGEAPSTREPGEIDDWVDVELVEGGAQPASLPEGTFGRSDASAIRAIIRSRRLREELFGAGLFADPAWDILLDLTAARIEGRQVAVSSLCIAAAVPATTALRWIKQLTEAGLLRRVADPDDRRRVFIELTDKTTKAMAAYFASVPRNGRG